MMDFFPALYVCSYFVALVFKHDEYLAVNIHLLLSHTTLNLKVVSFS